MTLGTVQSPASAEELRAAITQSLRYHEKRQKLCEAFGKSLEFTALTGSAGAVLALLEIDAKAIAIVLSATAAVASLLIILLSPASRQAVHTTLRSRLLDLQARLQADQTPEGVSSVSQALLEIGKSS